MKNYTCLQLEQIMKNLALLDFIMLPEEDDFWLRHVVYYPAIHEGVTMAKVDNGSGDQMYLLFSEEGAIIKGFDHESVVSPFGDFGDKYIDTIYNGIPDALYQLLTEDTEPNDVTFCIWRSQNSLEWKENKIQISDGGRSFLLDYIIDNAKEWVDWAEEYFDSDQIALAAVECIYNQMPITAEVIHQINPNCGFGEVINYNKFKIS